MKNDKTESLTVLIADDHEFFRQWLRDELKKHFPMVQSIAEANTAQEAIAAANENKIDLVFMDIDFGSDRSISGLDAAEQIWQKNSEAAIILVSNHKGEVYIRKLYAVVPQNGAYGYVLKERITQHLASAVEAVLEGDCWIDPEIARIVTRLSRKDSTLTDNEYEALMCIALGLSDYAAGQVLCITEKAIQARLQLLYGKLGVPAKGENGAILYNPRCRAIWCALQRGLINESGLNAWAMEIAKRSRENSLGLHF